MKRVQKLKDNITLIFIWGLFIIAIYFIISYMIEQGFFCHIYANFCYWFSKNEITIGTLQDKGINELFAGLGALFTFIAFFGQYLANKRQDEIQEIQSRSYSEEKTQTFLMQLIHILRDNSDNIQIHESINKKKAFHFMFYEYKCVYDVFMNRISNQNFPIQSILSMSYSIFINGIYKMDEKKDMISQNKLITKTAEKLKIPTEIVNNVLEDLLKLRTYSDDEKKSYFFLDQYGNYKEKILFFDGHRQSLSHTTKMLLETINFVCSTDILEQKRIEYFKLIGCQMSDHELSMYILHFNYLNTIENLIYDLDNINNGFEVMLKYMDCYMIDKLSDLGITDKNKICIFSKQQ